MKKLLLILTSCFILFAPIQSLYSSQEEQWDIKADQKIKTCMTSDTFQNITLTYSYKKQKWKLRIIFNPKNELIELSNGQISSHQFYYGIFSIDLPSDALCHHIEEVILSQLEGSSGGFIGFATCVNGQYLSDYFAGARACQGGILSKDESKEYSQADQRILELFQAQSFEKLSLDYKWEEKSYPVHFVYNPQRKHLFCNSLEKPVQWPFAMTIDASSYPLGLVHHLKSLVPNKLLNDPNSVVDMAQSIFLYTQKHHVSLYKDLSPILLLTAIENPDVDAEIQTLFTSSQLTKKSLCYKLNGHYYPILLIHNPENQNLESTLSFDAFPHSSITHTVTWDKKIGIFAYNEAPQELIDHLSTLYELSYWDSFWNNLSIYNGDKVSIIRYPWCYTPFSWYTFMLNATPS